MKAGRFREDLYYRLLGLPIELPPLRDRENDIVLLTKFFLDEFVKDNKMPKVQISPEAQKKIRSYHWPGNVRELKAVIELAAVLAEDNLIQESDINYNSTNSLENLMMEEMSLKDYTAQIISHFLNKYDQNVVKVAKKLDIGKSTIYRMIKNDEITI